MATRRRATTFMQAGALLAALLLAGCEGRTDEDLGPLESPAPIVSEPAEPTPSDTKATEDPGTGDGTPEPGVTATETAAGPPFAADTAPDTAEPTGEGETFLSVTNVRVAEHDRYDRVVFDLDGTGSGKPGWRVEYVNQATDDGSGHAVQVDGDAILRVSLSGTANPMDSGVEEFPGDRIEPDDTESVNEIVYRYWFEGYTTAFLGIDEGKRPFRTFLLENPTRVVVDVQH
ncbi:AMIN-like domain-containing (lipo)protein [Promicromonospora sp. CA-289599]|uniref:AMIN-like domain-containing (lipo)protein n=1 Tax=Promicromonospora sp. CA-289599 TaxID=3240014 RepID=UPI003D94DB35